MNKSKKLTKSKELGIFLVLVAMLLIFSILSPQFLKLNNIFNITKQIATLGICSVGFTFVLITGGIDLSLGYQISLINIICAYLMTKSGVHWVLAILISMLVGTLIGCINGIIITKTGVAPLIVTLSVMQILNGLSYLISKGLPMFGFPKAFSVLGGVSSNGGKGTMLGAFIGVLIVGVLDNGLLLLNVSEYFKLVIKGLILLVAVIYDTMSRSNSEKIKRMKAINVENA